MERRILETVRDAADPFVAYAEDCLKRLGIERRSFVKIVIDLQRRGLVDVDEGSGTIRLTDTGRNVLERQENALQATDPATTCR